MLLRFARRILPVTLTAAACVSPPLFAEESDFSTRWNAYAGAVGATSRDDVDCEGSACNGIFDSTPYYGLSLGASWKVLDVQTVVSQDRDGKPELTLAQLAATGYALGTEATVRAGKIINPLGLYGANRITPTARPGLILPQSFFLNSFYDLLTTSEYGAAIELRRNDAILKGAVFRAEDDTVFNIAVNDEPGDTGGNLIEDILGNGLGLGILPGAGDDAGGGGGGSTDVTAIDVEKNSYYLGARYDGMGLLADAGFVKLDIGNDRLNVYTAGLQTQLGNLLPSVEVLHLESNNTGEVTRGYSFTAQYQQPDWEAFANWTHFDGEGTESEDYNLGIAYYVDKFSFKLSTHILESTATLSDNSSTTLLDTQTFAASVGYVFK